MCLIQTSNQGDIISNKVCVLHIKVYILSLVVLKYRHYITIMSVKVSNRIMKLKEKKKQSDSNEVMTLTLNAIF